MGRRFGFLREAWREEVALVADGVGPEDNAFGLWALRAALRDFGGPDSTGRGDDDNAGSWANVIVWRGRREVTFALLATAGADGSAKGAGPAWRLGPPRSSCWRLTSSRWRLSLLCCWILLFFCFFSAALCRE
jgi:hypothetical protein